MAAAVSDLRAGTSVGRKLLSSQNGGPWDNQLKTPDVFLKVFIVFEHI